MRSQVAPPAAVGRDLALALAEDGLAEDAQDFLAVGERHLADGQARRLLEKDGGQAVPRHAPDLDRDRDTSRANADHGRMTVLDRPQTIRRRGGRLGYEGGAHVTQVLV